MNETPNHALPQTTTPAVAELGVVLPTKRVHDHE